MPQLKLGRNLSLPSSAVTQTWAWMGRKGSGKSYGAGKFCELLLANGDQVVVLDPVGVWYGLRLNKRGTGKSEFPIPIIGGDHGDIPLDDQSGGTVAKYLVESRSNCIIDISQFNKAKRKQFMTDFATALFESKKRQRSPLHLVIDEAQLFIPQRVGAAEAQMVGACEDMIRLGRNFGIGVSMISQRPQSVNKEVLNQAEPLVVFQMTAAHERKAVESWIEENADRTNAMVEELGRLAAGECFVWSPAWLRSFERTKILTKATFDSSSTPTAETTHVEPRRLSEGDITALSAELQSMVEQAKADDPKALRAEIANLQRQLKAAESKTEQVDYRARDDQWRGRLHEHDLKWRKFFDQIVEAIELPRPILDATKPSEPEVMSCEPETPAKASRRAPAANGSLPRGEAAILAVAIQYPDGVDRRSLSVMTSFKRSTRDAYIQRLSEKGYVSKSGTQVIATDAGRAAMPDARPLPTGAALRRYWMDKLPKGEASVLNEAIHAFPGWVARSVVTEATGFKRSTRDAYIQRLKAKLVIDIGSPGIRASDVLFND